MRVETLAVADFYDIDARRSFLEPLVLAINSAAVVTGHNVLRFDLPVIRADAMRTGCTPLEPTLVQDTIRVGKAKGFKKGQDVMADLLGVPAEKLPLHWGAWAKAYGEDGMATVKERVAGDVVQHMLLREAMKERGWLMAPRMWSP